MRHATPRSQRVCVCVCVCVSERETEREREKERERERERERQRETESERERVRIYLEELGRTQHEINLTECCMHIMHIITTDGTNPLGRWDRRRRERTIVATTPLNERHVREAAARGLARRATAAHRPTSKPALAPRVMSCNAIV